MSDSKHGSSNLEPGTLNFEPRTFLFVLLAVVVTIPVVWKSRPSGPVTAPAAFPVVSSAKGYVRVGGDVRHPGIYLITANTVTNSVIMLAVPLRTPTAYVPAGSETVLLSSGIDLRVVLDHDGTARIISGPLPVVQRLVLGMPLEINAMSETDFERLPGIGPALAQRIVSYRHKNGGSMMVEELLSIEGIGEKKYNRLKKYFN